VKQEQVKQEQVKQEQVKQEQVKQEQVKEEIIKPKEESVWIKKIKTQQKKVEEKINMNDPKYWEGPIWIGPVFIRGNKIGDNWKKYIENANKLSSAIIIPNMNTKWSRDGVNWYNSYEETFSPEHLKKIEDYEWKKEMKLFAQRTMEIHERRREESERHYMETGEIDDFLWAEIEHQKYEEYCAKLEQEWEEAEIEEEREEEEEYLEEEDYD